MPWVTINHKHVLIGEDTGGGHDGSHNPAESTGHAHVDKAMRGQPDPNISASDYAQQMAELRANQPTPINKLWRNPELAPPERVAEQQAKIKAWNSEYRKVTKLQKLALARDNAAYWARQSAVNK